MKRLATTLVDAEGRCFNAKDTKYTKKMKKNHKNGTPFALSSCPSRLRGEMSFFRLRRKVS